MQKNILFISYDGLTDPLGQSQVIPYLQGLSKYGYRFFLLSCEKKEIFNKNEATVRAMLNGYAISWIPIPYTKKPPVISTLKDIIRLKKEASKLHKQYGIDMVHTRPGIPALVGLWMKKKTGVKFLHDIREFWADSRIDGGIWNKKNPLFNTIYRFFKKKEDEELSHADGIVCLTHAAEKIIQHSTFYKKNTPLSVIPCSVDLDLFNPLAISSDEKSSWKKKLKIKDDDLVVSYLGSIGGWYMTKEMMQFCKVLHDKKPNAKFLFISPHLHEVIVNEAIKYGLPTESVIVTHARRNEVPMLLSLSNYSLFFIKPCYSKLSSSPTKHGEIMAMGIPVITNSGVGDVKEIVEQYHSGFVMDNFEKFSIESIVNKMLSVYDFDQDQIRLGAKEVYSLDKAIEIYQNLYNVVFYPATKGTNSVLI